MIKVWNNIGVFFCFCKFSSHWIRFTLNIIYISFSFNKYIINRCINILIRRNAIYVLVIDLYFSIHCCYQIQNCMVVFWGRFKRIDVFLNIYNPCVWLWLRYRALIWTHTSQWAQVSLEINFLLCSFIATEWTPLQKNKPGTS